MSHKCLSDLHTLEATNGLIVTFERKLACYCVEEKLDDNSDIIRELEKEVERLEERVEDLSNSNSDLEDSNAELDEKNEELKELLEESKEENLKLQAVVNELS